MRLYREKISHVCYGVRLRHIIWINSFSVFELGEDIYDVYVAKVKLNLIVNIFFIILSHEWCRVYNTRIKPNIYLHNNLVEMFPRSSLLVCGCKWYVEGKHGVLCQCHRVDVRYAFYIYLNVESVYFLLKYYICSWRRLYMRRMYLYRRKVKLRKSNLHNIK